MTRSPALKTGIGIAVVYLVVVLVTGALRPDGARPLFDGFAPPPSYRFIDPPPFFASGNVRPHGVSTSVALGPAGSVAAGVATPDGQFVIDLARGAIAPRAGASSVSVKITPVAPSGLGAVPGGSRPDGNAYHLDMTYEPGGARVTALARPGTMLVAAPELTSELLHSPDGAAWRTLPSRAVTSDGLSLSAALPGSGYYLTTTTLPELSASPAGSSGSHRTAVLLAVVIGVLALALVAFAFWLGGRRGAARQSG